MSDSFIKYILVPLVGIFVLFWFLGKIFDTFEDAFFSIKNSETYKSWSHNREINKTINHKVGMLSSDMQKVQTLSIGVYSIPIEYYLFMLDSNLEGIIDSAIYLKKNSFKLSRESNESLIAMAISISLYSVLEKEKLSVIKDMNISPESMNLFFDKYNNLIMPKLA